jgi:hypothetical protein
MYIYTYGELGTPISLLERMWSAASASPSNSSYAASLFRPVFVGLESSLQRSIALADHGS